MWLLVCDTLEKNISGLLYKSHTICKGGICGLFPLYYNVLHGLNSVYLGATDQCSRGLHLHFNKGHPLAGVAFTHKLVWSQLHNTHCTLFSFTLQPIVKCGGHYPATCTLSSPHSGQQAWDRHQQQPPATVGPRPGQHTFITWQALLLFLALVFTSPNLFMREKYSHRKSVKKANMSGTKSCIKDRKGTVCASKKRCRYLLHVW